MIKKQSINVTLKNEGADEILEINSEQSFLIEHSSRDSVKDIEVTKEEERFIKKNESHSCEFYALNAELNKQIENELVEKFLHTMETEGSRSCLFDTMKQVLSKERSVSNGVR